jgi:hypothetical protein
LASAKSLGYFAPLVALLVTSIAIRSSSFNSKGFLSLTSQLNETKSSTNKVLFAVGVLSLLTTSSFFSYHYQVRQLISQREQTPQVLAEYVAELNWIRSHTDSEAILITNLFLCPKNVLLSECSEFMKDKTGLSTRVVAASTQRRVLIEGPRFHAPVERFPRWISDRLDVVYSILNGKPNALKLLSRTNQNIYFVLSKTSARIAVDQGWIGVNFRNNLNVLGSSIHESKSFSIFDISNFSKLVDTSG